MYNTMFNTYIFIIPVISSLPQPLVAVPAYMCVELVTWLLPLGLGCAAGTMLWMVFAELMPDGAFPCHVGAYIAARVVLIDSDYME
mmetsp:Transcript_69677/g.185866  ORF Transcript_69677/g.185866 Transcript_69677/m.185866 type:complete len:86 (-) Transcript_69677:82-339(-)